MESVKEAEFWTPWSGNINDKLKEMEVVIDNDDLQKAVSYMFEIANSLGDESEDYWVSKCIEDFLTGEIIRDIINEMIENEEEHMLVGGDIISMKDLARDKWYRCEMDMDNNIAIYNLNEESIRNMYKEIKEGFE